MYWVMQPCCGAVLLQMQTLIDVATEHRHSVALMVVLVYPPLSPRSKHLNKRDEMGMKFVHRCMVPWGLNSLVIPWCLLWCHHEPDTGMNKRGVCDSHFVCLSALIFGLPTSLKCLKNKFHAKCNLMSQRKGGIYSYTLQCSENDLDFCKGIWFGVNGPWQEKHYKEPRKHKWEKQQETVQVVQQEDPLTYETLTDWGHIQLKSLQYNIFLHTTDFLQSADSW